MSFCDAHWQWGQAAADGAQGRTSQNGAPRRTEETSRTRLQASGQLEKRNRPSPESHYGEPTAGYVLETQKATGPAHKPTSEGQGNLGSSSQQQPRPAKPSQGPETSMTGPRKNHGEIAPRRTEQNKAEPTDGDPASMGKESNAGIRLWTCPTVQAPDGWTDAAQWKQVGYPRHLIQIRWPLGGNLDQRGRKSVQGSHRLGKDQRMLRCLANHVARQRVKGSSCQLGTRWIDPSSLSRA